MRWLKVTLNVNDRAKGKSVGPKASWPEALVGKRRTLFLVTSSRAIDTVIGRDLTCCLQCLPSVGKGMWTAVG